MTLTKGYTYVEALHGSLQRAWTVDDCFQGRDFDFSKSFLPPHRRRPEPVVSRRRRQTSAEPDPRQQLLPHLRVRRGIHRANGSRPRRADVYGDETRLWALLRFAEEEVKHQQMLRRACDQFEAGFGVTCSLIPGREEVADVVLHSAPLTALLLTSLIEWFTQLHYVEHVRADNELDPLFRDLLRFHWIDEARHAKVDSLMIEELTDNLTLEQREQAVDELLQLGAAIDGLLQKQIELDIETLERAAGRPFSDEEKTEIRGEQRRAYRWTFLVSGLEHPNFIQIVDDLTETGGSKIAAAARSLT